ncbi:MAG TPA: hypothetical protein VFH22_11580 [Rhodocyclaceae bacterium]|nr:hypothetical protein [Rhodocyclaceae bacterium]
MKVWRVLGRGQFQPPPADWREALARRLGQRPRRIGSWAELALAGALACLDEAGETTLPASALLSLSSLSGPETVLLGSVQNLASELPMPIAFLQSQPGQVLPVLAQHLRWSGNGRCLTTRDPVDALRLACLEADPAGGLLLGWVDEASGGKSLWLRAAATASAERTPNREASGIAELMDSPGREFQFDRQGRLLVA